MVGMFLVEKQLLENMVNEFLVQLMTGAVDLSSIIKVYDSGDCVIVLHNLVPVMLKGTDASKFRQWSQGAPSVEERLTRAGAA